MIELRDLVYSVLSNLTSAQEKADRMACDSARKYRDDQLLQYLPVPNASFDEVDLDLRFKVLGPSRGGKEDSSKSSELQPLEPSHAFVRQVAHALAREALSAMGKHDTRKAEKLARHLLEDVHGFLAQAGETRETDTGSAIEKTAETLESRIQSAFAGDGSGREAMSQSREPRVNGMMEILESARSRAAFLRDVAPSVPDLKIDLGVQTDESNLQQLRLKLRMRGYRWIATDESGQQKLVPEGRG